MFLELETLQIFETSMRLGASASIDCHRVTLVVFGRYQEICDTPEFRSERTLAFNLLQQKAMWWEHGGARRIPDGTPAAVPVYYRIKIEQINGWVASSDQAVPGTRQATGDVDEQAWLRKMFRRDRQT